MAMPYEWSGCERMHCCGRSEITMDTACCQALIHFTRWQFAMFTTHFMWLEWHKIWNEDGEVCVMHLTWDGGWWEGSQLWIMYFILSYAMQRAVTPPICRRIHVCDARRNRAPSNIDPASNSDEISEPILYQYFCHTGSLQTNQILCH